MKISSQIKAGAKLAPAFFIMLYYLFILLDIYTTYLATPDLRYEGNWMVRSFNMGWSQILIKDFLIVTFMTITLLLALNYTHGFFQSNIRSNTGVLIIVFKNKKLLISLIILGTFYSHFIYTVFVTVNNYLAYVYLYQTDTIINSISTFYVNKTMIEHPLFHLYAQLLAPIPGYIVATYKVKKIRNKYRAISIGSAD